MEANSKLLQLFSGNSLGTLIRGISVAIEQSMQAQEMRNPTRDEVKFRFNICMRWAETLRGDLSWGVQRIVDSLPEILRTELSGQQWTPGERTFWVPEDGSP